IGLVYLPVSLRNSPSLVTSGNFQVSSGGSDFTGSNLVLSDSTGSNLNVNQNIISFSINERFILPRFVSFRVRYQL
ncbi:MAG: hypothetical protein NWP54_00795, partial [Polaribacter sp.]|nr:hypothetical protein [Polaribacter sp.]